MKKNNSSISQYLLENGTITYWNKGISMWPLIRQNKDTFTVESRQENEVYEKYDVILYKRNEQLILHRIVGFYNSGYVVLGDSTYKKEYVPYGENILGRMVSVTRDGRVIKVTDQAYIAYVYFWRMIFPLRLFFYEIKQIIKAVVEKVAQI